MGATVTCGKKVCAFQSKNNEIVYVLFEQTYEKNCYPHTPHWSCIHIGKLESTMRCMFRFAHACEGGSLQGRGGHITPEGYIQGWLKELASPTLMPDQVITLRIGNWRASISNEKPEYLECTIAALSTLSRNDIAEKLKNKEEVLISLIENSDVVLALFEQRITGSSPWTIVDMGFDILRASPCPELGYAPTPTKHFTIDVPDAMKVDQNNRLVKSKDGKWCCEGWEYSIVGHFIANLADAELAEPGSYRKRIGAFRDAVMNAPMIPDGTKVRLNLNAEMNDWVRENMEKLVTAYGGNPILIRPEMSGSELYHLAQFTGEQATWLIPGDLVSGSINPSTAVQLDFLMAV